VLLMSGEKPGNWCCTRGGLPTVRHQCVCHRSHRLHWVLMALLALLLPVGAQDPQTPTPENYVAHVGRETRVVPAGEFALDGHKLYFATRPTVTDDQLDDYGATYPRILIMNTRVLAKLSTPIKLWIYSHE